RVFAWMTDIGPHWCPKAFTEWDGYQKIWQQAILWLAKR
ncbi:MAG TPA: cytoplasmic protein, partial [Spirochaetales bacterium]|nr:cytoplasmic protein [Spirochaetales bacterium]